MKFDFNHTTNPEKKVEIYDYVHKTVLNNSEAHKINKLIS